MSPLVHRAIGTSPDTVLVERYYLAGNFVVGIGYGLQLVLWFLCTSYLWSRRDRGLAIRFLLAFLALLLAMETTFAVAQAHLVQSMYIDHRNDDGGPWQYFLDTQDLPTDVVYHASLFILTFLGDVLVLWRCWVIWSAFERRIALLVTSLPATVLTASFIVGAVWTEQSIHQERTLAWGTAYYAISMVLNFALTALIALRLLLYRRAHISLLPEDHAQQYLSLIAIVVESAAIHTAFALAFITSYALNAPINQVFVGCTSAAQQVATYLIIYRVADGKAWSKDTPKLHTVTSIKFASRAASQAIISGADRSTLVESESVLTPSIETVIAGTGEEVGS